MSMLYNDINISWASENTFIDTVYHCTICFGFFYLVLYLLGERDFNICLLLPLVLYPVQ